MRQAAMQLLPVIVLALGVLAVIIALASRDKQIQRLMATGLAVVIGLLMLAGLAAVVSGQAAISASVGLR